MDWINEKIEHIQKRVRNLSLKKSLLSYLIFAVFLSIVCTWGTKIICQHQLELLYRRHGAMIERVAGEEFYMIVNENHSAIDFTSSEMKILVLLGFLEAYAEYGFMLFFTVIMGIRFYHTRLKRPTELLTYGTKEIRNHNLNVKLEYDCKDEMGELCRAFNEMQQELSDNKEKMWGLIEEQKKVNAAFAHDLRTPLTVLKGYSDFLFRFIPEGKVSEEKLVNTVKLMAEHIGRLERYSYTMKDIRNLDERKVQQEEQSFSSLVEDIQETANAMNQIGDVQITVTVQGKKEESLWIDKEMVLEVVDNLLSNAIRFAASKVEICLETSEEDLLRIYVKDDGPGFTEEKMKKAKEPYYYDEEQKKDGEHFGIGLHISEILCEKCGGTLDLANSIHGGAFVSVSFSYRKS